MATISPLAAAVDTLVHDGAEIAFEGPVAAAAAALVRRGPRGLTLVASDPGPAGDRLVGAGCVERLVFCRLVGTPRILDALASGWPTPLEPEEHPQAGLAARYAAGAAGLPFATVRAGYAGTDLARAATVRCPFTGEVLTALPALRPDLAVVHAPRADRAGNVQLGGGLTKEAVLAARRSLVTVDELVDELGPGPVLPGVLITTVAVAPGSAEAEWPAVAADRAGFGAWLARVRA